MFISERIRRTPESTALNHSISAAASSSVAKSAA